MEKKRGPALLLAALMLLTATGCAAFDKDYYYEVPYSGDLGIPAGDAVEIRNYSMLKSALTTLINNHRSEGEFRFSNYNGNPNEGLAAACFEIKSTNPLGVYAVESLSYETSHVVSYYMANIYITYKKSESEIRDILYVTAPSEFDDQVCAALAALDPGVVLRIYSNGVDETHVRELVHRYTYDNPVTMVREPVVAVETFPTDGPNRIYDIRFDYGLPLQNIRPMSATLERMLQTAAAGMQETAPAALALESARYLSTLCADGDPDSPYRDTAYGAFVIRSAGDKGLALAYRALCAQLGLDCRVVQGAIGATDAQPHYWNILALDGEYYHVDLSVLDKDPAAAFLLRDEDIWGPYIWTVEDYPACSGPLRYADVANSGEAAVPTADITAAPTQEETGETPDGE